MTELGEKYQKLASEYAKVRSQVNVLKKGVFDEQSNVEYLKNIIKEREQSLRKYEQEVDSLNFRNQQLSSRVVILQKQIDDNNALNHKNKKVMSTSVSDFRLKAGAIDEELRLKIEENILLHRQVESFEFTHKNDVLKLEENLQLMEKQNIDLVAEVSRLNNINKQCIQQIIDDKTNFESLISKQDMENKELKKSLHEIEKKFNVLNVSPNPELEILRERQLNVIVSRIVKWSKKLIYAINSLLTNANERASIQIFNNDSTSLLHASKLLHDSINGFNNPSKYLVEFLSKFVHNSNSLILYEKCKELFALLKIFINSMEQILNNFINCLQAECSNSSLPISLIEINNLVIPSIQNILQNILSKFSLFEENFFAIHSSNNEFIDKFLNSYDLSTIYLSDIIISELEANVYQKFEIEKNLPTTSDSMKKTNVNIATSFQQLIFIFKQFPLSENAHLCNDDDDVNVLPDHQDNILILTQEQNAINDEFINNDVKLKEYLESEISKLGKRISDLETEKERWALDLHLLRFKYEKYIQKLTSNCDKAFTSSTDSELCSREMEIVKYHRKVVHSQYIQLQMAESKAIFFQAESIGLQELLTLNENKVKKLKEKLKESQHIVSSLKDEIVTTRHNYEDQLSTMSDHLASLNETIIKQKDEIDALHFQIQQKTNSSTVTKKIKS